jgi:signal transduction histidine kinase
VGVAMQRESLGPVRATFDALDPAGQEALANGLKQAMAQFNTATDGTVVVLADYLEVVAVKAN